MVVFFVVNFRHGIDKFELFLFIIFWFFVYIAHSLLGVCVEFGYAYWAALHLANNKVYSSYNLANI